VIGNVSFDLDGVLANFIRGFLRVGHDLYGTPVGGHHVHKTWAFEDWTPLGLDQHKTAHMWEVLFQNPRFWSDLDPENVSIMERINLMTNRLFITNRAGINPKMQSIEFLEKWGVMNPRVYVAKDKVPIAQREHVIAHIDDYYPNCVEIKQALPDAYVALLWTQYNEQFHNEWRRMGGEVVLSVDEFCDALDNRGLSRYELPTTRSTPLAMDSYDGRETRYYL
jgi:hypothetical protein